MLRKDQKVLSRDQIKAGVTESKRNISDSNLPMLYLAVQLQILFITSVPPGGLPSHAPHRFGHASPHPHEKPHKREDETDGDENAENVADHAAFASRTWIEEAIGVEALGGMGNVNEGEVEGEE